MNTAQTEFTIIAIGGGGFTHETDPDLEDFILAQSPVKHPNIGFIGAASHDSPSRIDLFYQRFLGSTQSPSHLLQSASIQTAKDWVSQQDIIYVGGGDTQHLLSYFRKNQLDHVLATAANSGTILAGVSAGAVCWYEFALSDAAGNGLEPLPGIGLIAGSCCPHYSSEPGRQMAFQQQISNGTLPNGIAIDDGVAVLTRSGQPPRFYSAREALGAYAVEKRGRESISTRIPLIE
ncbi:peptidase E [Oceanospirillaceae bacterium]|jgi:dipeptidase E|nr:peptidase E [Oceanospirillaceae bacterium]MDC1506535.1 peptidase E [Oceanospirillaceae bacterium]|tara:strand:+ start:1892 stop:2593 length:702 start_codon:yes stop_codon:yes gene_type:complete